MAQGGRTRWVKTFAGLALAGVIMCVPTLADRAMTHSRQRRVGEEAARRAREGAGLAREALALQTESVAMMTENAVANPRFMAAVRGRVSRDTFADLLATESWWEAYRGLRAAISYDSATLAFAQTEGADGVAVGAIVRRVWGSGRPASAAMSGRGGAFLVAARPASLGRDRAAVLVLAKRIDDPLLAVVAQGAGRAVLLSDGTRSLGRGGENSAVLEPLAGLERAADAALPALSAAHAAAVAVAPGLWLWSLGLGHRRRERGGGRRLNAASADLVGCDWARGRDQRAVDLPAAAAERAAGAGAGVGARGRERHRSERDPRGDGDRRFDDRAGRHSSRAGDRARPLPAGRSDRRGWDGGGVHRGVVRAGAVPAPFVIKRLRAELDGNATAVGPFIDEANVASTLVHPNVVPVFDFGEVGGSYFLAAGVHRRARSRPHHRPPGDPVSRCCRRAPSLYVANELLNGLAYAHDKHDDEGRPLGLVHRDVTPENVIISERGEVKILDFGIVKAKQRVSHTDSGTVQRQRRLHGPRAGARPFRRSPIRSVLDRARDVYAATGEPTYPGQTFYDLLTAAAAGPAEPQRARIAALPAPLPAILTRALEVDPDRRFQSSAEFSAALVPHLTGGAPRELATRLLALFGPELRAEQDRLAAAFPHAPALAGA